LASTVPLAILSNAFRVAASAWAPALDSGTPHQILGWAIFTLTLAMLLPLRSAFNALYGRHRA
jgi:hypothetical protein